MIMPGATIAAAGACGRRRRLSVMVRRPSTITQIIHERMILAVCRHERSRKARARSLRSRTSRVRPESRRSASAMAAGSRV
jgi:hypothetical protein